MPDTVHAIYLVITILNILPHLILTTIFYSPHFIDEEIKIEKRKVCSYMESGFKFLLDSLNT